MYTVLGSLERVSLRMRGSIGVDMQRELVEKRRAHGGRRNTRELEVSEIVGTLE